MLYYSFCSVFRWKVFFQQVKSAVYLALTLPLMAIVIPVFAVICYPLWLVALTFSHFDPTLGRFARYLDVWMDEDFTKSIPKSSIVVTMTLDGHLPLELLKSLFRINILEARLSTNSAKLRYPELGQYLTSFMGFRIWKNEWCFDIDNHISQKYQEKGSLDLQAIHYDMINKQYNEEKSPWEIILYHSTNETRAESVIAARFHHSMIDARSILKLMVEGLGQKPLKTATAVPQHSNTFAKNLQFIVMFPFNYVCWSSYIFYKFCTTHSHPWKLHKFQADKCTKLSMAFSSKLELSDLKQVAKDNRVVSSSVVMALITGSVRNCGVSCLAERDILVGSPLPKENHPEFMVNHVYMGILALPTDQSSVVKRLQKCNETFVQAKAAQTGKFSNVLAMEAGSLIGPLSRKLAVNYFIPMFMTNIAGEAEGFSVGGCECSDFRMTVGTLQGTASVIFCVFSYKDGVRVGVAARESVVSKEQTEKMAANISAELKALLAI